MAALTTLLSFNGTNGENPQAGLLCFGLQFSTPLDSRPSPA